MYSPGNHARQRGSQASQRNIARDSIQIQHHQREALRIGIYQTPRVEDKPIGNHQRIHDIDNGRNVALYNAQMISKWRPPLTKGGSLTLHFLVPVKKGTAVSLRVFNVASNSTYKYKVLAGDVNVARPKSTGIDQDYFVAPAHEWVYGTRFADDPRTVRQFQVLQSNSGLSLASILSKDDSIKCMEIQISSPKCDGVTDAFDPEVEAACLGCPTPTGYNMRPVEIQHMHSHVFNQVQSVAEVQSLAQVQRFNKLQPRPQSFTEAQSVDLSQTATPVHIPHTCEPLELDGPPKRFHRISMDSSQMQDPNPKMIDQLRHMMDICPGGLVRQKFTLDDDPGQWKECYEVVLRIHLIDEKRFETVTGLSLDAFNSATSHAQNTFVPSDPAPRRFVRDFESSGGLPSVAQMWEQMKRAKARARVSPDTTSTGRQVQSDDEKPKAKQPVGKLGKYLFVCGK